MTLYTVLPILLVGVNLNLPSVDLAAAGLRLLSLVPLIGGYLLAREGKGNVGLEIAAVTLLVLATIVPSVVSLASTSDLLPALLNKLPVALLLIGLAFVRDGGFRMIIGLVLIVVSGFVLVHGS